MVGNPFLAAVVSLRDGAPQWDFSCGRGYWLTMETHTHTHTHTHTAIMSYSLYNASSEIWIDIKLFLYVFQKLIRCVKIYFYSLHHIYSATKLYCTWSQIDKQLMEHKLNIFAITTLQGIFFQVFIRIPRPHLHNTPAKLAIIFNIVSHIRISDAKYSRTFYSLTSNLILSWLSRFDNLISLHVMCLGL